MIENYKKVVFENYANFKGRARRSEYWYFVLMQVVIITLLTALLFTVGDITGNTGAIVLMLVLAAYYFFTLIPTLAVMVRRLQDTNRKWYFLFVNFVPFGSIILIIFFVSEGTKGTNDFGRDPKNPSLETEDHLLED